PLVHAVKRRLGIVLIDLGRTAEGEALLEEVLEQRRARLGEDHPDTAQSQVDVASARIQVLRGDGAERMLRHAIQVFQDPGAGEHDTVAQAYNLLAEELMHHGEVDEADHLMRTALARVKERFGPFHPSVTNVMTNYGTLLSMRGEHERARE